MEFVSTFRNELNYIKKFTFPNYLTGFWIKFDFLKSLFLLSESWINLKGFDGKTKGRCEKINEAEVLNFVNYIPPSSI